MFRMYDNHASTIPNRLRHSVRRQNCASVSGAVCAFAATKRTSRKSSSKTFRLGSVRMTYTPTSMPGGKDTCGSLKVHVHGPPAVGPNDKVQQRRGLQ